MMDSIAEATDVNQITATLAMDLSAAFDCVMHATLHEKLELYGFDLHSRNWIKSYLNYRSSYIAIGSAVSEIKSTPHGVPQGSVLGPLLYLVYVNEMPSANEDDFCVNQLHSNTDNLFNTGCDNCGHLTMYADDGLFGYSSNSRDQNQDKIEQTFWRLKNFLNANGLKINESKTKLTEFMTRQKRVRTRGIPPDLTIQEEIVNKRGISRLEDKLVMDTGQCKMLGIKLQNSLSWEQHLTGKKSLLPRTRSLIGRLYKICHHMSRKASAQLVTSLIISKLAYGIALWGNTSTNYIRKAQVVLNSAARLVTQLPKHTRQRDLMTQLNWLDIENLTRYHSMLHIWKVIRLKTPRYLTDKLQISSDDKITTSNPRLVLTARSFRWNSVTTWNSLPGNIRQETNLRLFKKQLKTLLRTTNYATDDNRPPDNPDD